MFHGRLDGCIVAVLLVVVCWHLPLAAQDVVDLDRLMLIDAEGKHVSTSVMGSPLNLDEVEALFQFEKQMFWLKARPEGLRATDHNLGFETADCTGPAFLFPPGDLPLVRFFEPVVLSGQTVWLPVPGAPVTSTFMGSRLDPGGCQQVGDFRNAVAAQAAVDLSGYIPPFRIVPGDHVHRSVAAEQTPPNTGKRARTGPSLPRAVPDVP